jgi:hypothetical protein
LVTLAGFASTTGSAAFFEAAFFAGAFGSATVSAVLAAAAVFLALAGSAPFGLATGAASGFSVLVLPFAAVFGAGLVVSIRAAALSSAAALPFAVLEVLVATALAAVFGVAAESDLRVRPAAGRSLSLLRFLAVHGCLVRSGCRGAIRRARPGAPAGTGAISTNEPKWREQTRQRP